MAINHAGGKGSRQRRSEVSDETIANNWALAFGKKEKAADPPPGPTTTTAAKNPDVSQDTAKDFSRVLEIIDGGKVSNQTVSVLLDLVQFLGGQLDAAFKEIGLLSDSDRKLLFNALFVVSTVSPYADFSTIHTLIKTMASFKNNE